MQGGVKDVMDVQRRRHSCLLNGQPRGRTWTTWIRTPVLRYGGERHIVTVYRQALQFSPEGRTLTILALFSSLGA